VSDLSVHRILLVTLLLCPRQGLAKNTLPLHSSQVLTTRSTQSRHLNLTQMEVVTLKSSMI
jgi:hypothetical protein